MQKNKSLVVMAAGMGSRFGGLKQLAKFGDNGETLLDFSIYDAIQAGFNHVVFIIRKDIEAEFKEVLGTRIEKQIEVDYVFQELDELPEGFTVPKDRKKPWGTGHAVLMAKDKINNPFVVINGDDYYGRDAFLKAAESLDTITPSQFMMASYILKNTLSDSGGVSRGICSVSEDQYLEKVDETHEVQFNADNSQITGSRNSHSLSFTGDEPTSMNFFAIHPEFFNHLQDAFLTFLSSNGTELKSEFYLPFVLTDQINSGNLKIKVVSTNAHWFGVTYAEDAVIVKKKLDSLEKQGFYPTPLWE